MAQSQSKETNTIKAPWSSETTGPGRDMVGALQRTVGRYKLLIVGIFGGVMLLDIGFVALTPKQYESSMSVLVRNTRGNLTVSSEKSIGEMAPPEVTEEQVNSELQLLKSQDLAEATFAPSWIPTQHSIEDRRAHEKLLNEFRKGLTVTASRKSNVLQVSLLADNPEKAQTLLNRLTTIFLAKERAMERPAGAASFFAKEADRYKDALERSERELSQLQQKTGVVSLPDQEADTQRQIQDLQVQERETDVEVSSLEQKISATRAEILRVPQRQPTLERQVPYQLSIEQLTVLLTTLMNKREELKVKFLPTDPLLVENGMEINNTNQALAKIRSTGSVEKAYDVSPAWQQLVTASSTLGPDLVAARVKRSTLRAQIDALTDQLSSLEGRTGDFARLKQAVTELSLSSQLYSQKREEADIADAMEEEKILNVAILAQPTVSYVPVSPKPLTDIFLGLVTATVLSAVLLYLLLSSDETYAVASNGPASEKMSTD